MIHMGISRSGSGTNSANRREQEFPLEGVFQWQQFDHLLRQRRNNPPLAYSRGRSPTPVNSKIYE
jgi:hypothetical protein